ncbi:MAG: hypothetical protein JWR18_1450, partial [Segetibacter sp.]|nr:hypothetical protein [Segetibacter sp.]
IEPEVFQLPQLHKHFNVSGNAKKKMTDPNRMTKGTN